MNLLSRIGFTQKIKWRKGLMKKDAMSLIIKPQSSHQVRMLLRTSFLSTTLLPYLVTHDLYGSYFKISLGSIVVKKTQHLSRECTCMLLLRWDPHKTHSLPFLFNYKFKILNVVRCHGAWFLQTRDRKGKRRRIKIWIWFQNSSRQMVAAGLKWGELMPKIIQG